MPEERNATGSLLARYVYGDDLLSRTTHGMPQYYLYDGLGSTHALSDASGTLTDSYRYDAYGMLLDSAGTTTNPYLYRGEQYAPALSAYYLRARYYQPGIGRFMTTDPMEGFPTDPLSLHRYQYGSCNPINMIDPSGKMTLEETLTVGEIIVGVCANLVIPNALGMFDKWYKKHGDWLPDAAVFGISGSINFMNLMDALAKLLGDLSASNWPNHPSGLTGGVELLFSISSAEIEAFWYWGLAWTPNETKLGSGSLYKAWVWNLWNSGDYSGPFVSGSVGPLIFFSSVSYGVLPNPWNGCYGMGYSVPLKRLSWLQSTSDWSGSYTAYKTGLSNLKWELNSEQEVGLRLIVAQLAFNTLQCILSQDTLAIKLLPVEISMTYLTWSAKRVWNKAHNIKIKDTGQADPPNTLYRQGSSRPEGWRSGPISGIVSRFSTYLGL